jgi:putative membrane protein insertion efficiency factor
MVGRIAEWIIRLPSLALIGVIMFHRRFLSRFTPPTCRFTPTCSRYALDAVRRYGVIRGGWLGIWRVMRCNPFHPGGYDPLR